MNVLLRRITSNRRILQSINSSLRFPSLQWYYQPCSEVLNSRSLTNTSTNKKPLNQDSLHGEGSKLTEIASQPPRWRPTTLDNLPQVLEYLKFEVKSQSDAKSEEVERMMRAREIVNQALLGIAKKELSLKEVEKEAIEVMRLLKDRGIYSNFYKGVAALIKQVLRVLRKEEDAVEDEVKMEVLNLCSKLRYRTSELTSLDRKDVEVLLEGIKIDYISESLSRYGDYFWLLASLDFPWKELSKEWRKKLLSCMRSFGELRKEGLPGAERLISGVELLFILKDHLQEIEEVDKRWYEMMLNELLVEKYGWKKVSSNENQGGGLTITSALLFQLKTLTRDGGRPELTKRQLELFYIGFGEEWKRPEMQIHGQCLTFLALGDLRINYKSVPTDVWWTMLEGLSKNIKQKGIKATKVSELLKGWRGMEVRWKALNLELQEAVMEAVAGLNEDGKSPRAIANAMLYLADIGVSWRLHVSEERKKRILLNVAKAFENCNTQEFSNTLLGLGKMGFKLETIHSHDDLREKILATIVSKIGEMNYQGVSNTIYSLANLGVKWKYFQKEAKTALYLSIKSTYTEMDERSLNALFYGLANINAYATDLPFYIRIILEACITRFAEMDYHEHKISAILLSFSKMGFIWKHLNQKTQDALVAMILNSANEFNSQDLANTMYGISKMMKDDPLVLKQPYFLPILQLLRSREVDLRKEKTFFGDEEETQFSLFYTWLERLPPLISRKVVPPESSTTPRRIPILKMF